MTAAATTAATEAPAMTEAATTAATEAPAMTEAATTAATEAPAMTAGATAAATTAAAGSATGNGATIKVGSKDFAEEFIVAEMYAQLLEANGFKVERKLNLGGTPIAQQALIDKEIDLYPEYTSTGLLTVLKLPVIQDPKQIYDKVKSEYEKQYQLTWLQPSPFNDTNALAMTTKRATELGIKTYSDLAAKAGDLVVGGPPEFYEREDGLPGLQKAYGGFNFKDTKQLDHALSYQALQSGDVDVIRAFSTDGELGSPDLTLLQDDKTYYPVYQIAPVVRMDTLAANPAIADILNKLATPALDEKTMAKLNFMVSGPDKKEPADVAKQWLTEQGLLK
jgi:osmoprotectant transport system substrate-binding protein